MKTLDIDKDIAGFTPRQMDAIKALDSGDKKYVLYGGALGGGKSYFLRWYGIRRLILLHQVYRLSGVVGMLACENYPSLKDRQLSKIGREFPSWLGKMHTDHKEYGRCFILRPRFGGGVLCFRNLDDPSKYQSAEFAFIMVDELTKNDYDTFTFLRSRLRWPGLPDIECQFVGGTNPGGIGHGWCKQLWMDKTFGPEWYPPVSDQDYRTQFEYIPSKAADNPHLDPGYWAVLNTLPEHLRGAFKDGNWDIFIGQAFSEFNRETHVIKSMPVPSNAPLYMTFDWGYGAPFSVGWWWCDADGRLYRFAEWYGWNGQPNQGLRMTDEAIAKSIVERESLMREPGAVLSANSSEFTRICDPACANKKPDYRGGGQGPSTIEEFARFGLHLIPGDAKRELKIRQFHKRLAVPEDGAMPMLVVYDSCAQFIRTIPNITINENKVEDVDKKTEDHVYDEAALLCMARPMSMAPVHARSVGTDRRIQRLYEKKNDDVDIFGEENELAWEDIDNSMNPYDDGATVNLV